MADVSKIDFKSANEAIQLPVGKSTYSLGIDGTIFNLTEGKLVDAGDKALRGKIAEQLEKAYLESPKLTPSQLGRFGKVVGSLSTAHEFTAFEKFMEANAQAIDLLAKVGIEGKATKAEIHQIGALLAEHPKLEEALTSDATDILKDTASEAKAFAGRITGATKEIEELAKNSKLTEDAAKGVLEKHGHEVVDHLPKKAVSAEVTAAKGAITKKIGEIHTALAGHYDEIVKHHNIIGDANSDAKAIAEAEKAIEKIMKDDIGKLKADNKAYVRYFDEAIENHAHKDLLRGGDIKGFAKHAEEVQAAAKSATAAVGDKAKLFTGGKWYSFKHTAETVGSELGKIDKIRWGKVGVVAGAAGVTGMVIAKMTDSKGPGKYSDQVVSQQQNVAEQGLGVA